MDLYGKLVTSKKKLEKRNYLTSNKLTSLEIRDRALSIMGDLASTEAPHDMTAWYCKAYRILGEAKMMAIVSMAKDPSVKDQRKLVGWLIREEMNAKQG